MTLTFVRGVMIIKRFILVKLHVRQNNVHKIGRLIPNFYKKSIKKGELGTLTRSSGSIT